MAGTRMLELAANAFDAGVTSTGPGADARRAGRRVRSRDERARRAWKQGFVANPGRIRAYAAGR